MPIWAPAIMRETCSIAEIVTFAAQFPSSAFGSMTERLAEISANSAPTKKAFRSRRTRVASRPT